MGSVRIDRLDHLVLTVPLTPAQTRYHLQGVNRGAGASVSMAAWW
jgi:hypothetical protein